MTNPEIILNLWYVQDDMDIIYSLRARTYLGMGTDEDKLALLQKYAPTDYLIARPFPIPRQYHADNAPIFFKRALIALDSPIALFEDAIEQLQSELPSQTNLDIPERPLVCITSLLGDDYGNIRPVIDEVDRLN